MPTEPSQAPVSTTSRRQFLRCSAGLIVGSLVGSSWACLAGAAEPAPSRMTPDEALRTLIEGNQRYVRGEISFRDFSATRAALVATQSPHSVVLGCSDSRVAPELIFDQDRGDLFVVRVAGNFVNVDGLASIEYAVKFLGASLILVLGHTNCGAVDAAIKMVDQGAELPGHLPELLRELKPAVEAAKREKGDLLANAIRANVQVSVADLQSARPILASAVAAGKLRIAGGIYDLATGKVEML